MPLIKKSRKMKKVFSLAAIAAFALSFASCKKCYDCSYDNAFLGTTQSQEICSGDGVSRSELDDAKSNLEAVGWDCE